MVLRWVGRCKEAGTSSGIPPAMPFVVPWGYGWAEEAAWRLGFLC